MSKIIKNPNIPKNKVITAIAGDMPVDLDNAFKSLGIKIFNVKRNAALQAPVASHADMLVHHLGDSNILITKNNDEVKETLKDLGFNPAVIQKDILKKYPHDILLNSARIGNFNVCNLKNTAKEIVDYCKNNKIEVIDVAQGYAKCSTCIVNEKAIITEDFKIKARCEQKGIDVLLIRKGYVNLSGYNYGFIGGCSALISEDILAFFGCIEEHPDYKIISSFLKKYNITPLSLTKNKLQDIGGIIPLLEEK